MKNYLTTTMILLSLLFLTRISAQNNSVIVVERIQITDGATDGYILQTDPNGNASWVDLASLINLPSPAYQQFIPTGFEDERVRASTSNLAGDTIFVATTGEDEHLIQLVKDTGTGQFYFSRSVSIPSAFDPNSLAILNGFLYMGGDVNGSISVLRYPTDLLSSNAYMNFVGAFPNDSNMFSDGTNLVIYDSGVGWTKFSPSGTDLINQGTVIISGSAGIDGSLFDGNNVYHWNGSSIRATTTTGVDGNIKSIGSHWDSWGYNSTCFGFANIDSQRIYLVSSVVNEVYTINNNSTLVEGDLVIILTPFSKP